MPFDCDRKYILSSSVIVLYVDCIAVGLSSYNVAIFHLINHAWFKALLFLSAGAVIHSLQDEQNQMRMGAFIAFLPFTYILILIGSLSLMALPFLTGWYSKDLILEVAFGQYQLSGSIAYWLGSLSAVFTACYSVRLLALTFFTYPNASISVYKGAHEAPSIIAFPLVILAISSIFFGFISKDLFVGVGSGFWSNSIFIHPDNVSLIEAEFAVPFFYKLLPLFSSLLGAGIVFVVYHFFYASLVLSLTNSR